jgi:hypothetical protein
MLQRFGRRLLSTQALHVARLRFGELEKAATVACDARNRAKDDVDFYTALGPVMERKYRLERSACMGIIDECGFGDIGFFVKRRLCDAMMGTRKE